MPKCDFKKVALELNRNHASAWLFNCKSAAYFSLRTPLEECRSVFKALPNIYDGFFCEKTANVRFRMNVSDVAHFSNCSLSVLCFGELKLFFILKRAL